MNELTISRNKFKNEKFDKKLIQKKIWMDKNYFLNKLYLVQQNNKTNTEKSQINLNCEICDRQNINKYIYTYNDVMWESSLKHYIKKHNFKPSDNFIKFIFELNLHSTILKGKIKNNKFIKLDKHQIMIMDALMEHGGYTKKYHDLKNINIVRYSEHAGYIQIEDNYIDSITISAKTLRIDRGDEEIFLPSNNIDLYNYKYIFHTHPPTPKVGGRIKQGILYEVPSVGDLIHFIDHYNLGKTVGSIVMTPEGLYIIKKRNKDANKIKIDEDKFYHEIMICFRKQQTSAIKKFKTNFDKNYFYSKIANDLCFINNVNKSLKKYDIKILYYPRTQYVKNKWIINDIYLEL